MSLTNRTLRHCEYNKQIKLNNYQAVERIYISEMKLADAIVL